MNESVRNAVEQQLKHVKRTGEQLSNLIKNLENELESAIKQMELVLKEKHELEKELCSPRSEKNE